MDASPSARVCRQCSARIARDNRHPLCATCQRRSRHLLGGAPDVPPEFWHDPELQAALRSRHMGAVIRAYRLHPFHGQPVRQGIVAGWVYLTQPQLSRVENGPALQELDRLIQWAQALRIPEELLWFKLPEEQDASQLPSSGLTAVPGPAPSVPAWSAVHVEELPQLQAARMDARRYFDGEIVTMLRRQLDDHKAADGQLGPASVLPRVLELLGTVQHAVGEVRRDVRHPLLCVGADGAEFVGWLYRDLRDLQSATYWYDRAIEWAQEADDRAMQGYVLLRKSQLAYDRRDALRVQTLAEAAQRSGTLPTRIRAEVTQQEALGMAMLGEPLHVVEAKLDAARQLLTTATAEDSAGPGALFSQGTLLLRSTACYTEAGKPGRAAEILSGVIASGTLSPRDAGYFQARRSAALALIGEPDEAAKVGLAASRVAQATRSSRTTTVLMDAMQTLARWGARPQVRALREALAEEHTA